MNYSETSPYKLIQFDLVHQTAFNMRGWAILGVCQLTYCALFNLTLLSITVTPQKWKVNCLKQSRAALFALSHHVDDVRWTQGGQGGKGPTYVCSEYASRFLTNQRTLSLRLVQVTIIQSWSSSSYRPVTMQSITPPKLSGITKRSM